MNVANASILENFRMAIDAIWSHRFRSSLTILGIVIGITTVVSVASLLAGLRQGIVVFFEELGPDNVFVYRTSGDPGSQGANREERLRRPLRVEYADIIRASTTSTVKTVGMNLFIPGVYRGRPLNAKVPGIETEDFNIVGTDANLLQASSRTLREGRLFTEDEARRGEKVAVIGAKLADILYPGGSALGRTAIFGGAEYQIIGVFDLAKGGFFGENGQDKQVSIPFRTARMRYPGTDNRIMIVCTALPGMRDQAQQEVEWIMRRIRKLNTADKNDFSLSTPDSIIQQFDKITGIVWLVSLALSGLGLLVGGIGVMNIMLVSVTERTREIGVRKAIGARRSDVISQFLMEAMTLTGLGGVFGIIFSLTVVLLIGLLFPSLSGPTPPWALAVGFGASVAVGLFFGVWPAVKAANLDPVEALRYE
ncbi:MAG: ABC transporter permease, partial [Bryobacterales bacterium]|nr:ABC transporter permease [Bryobacterales bacterium]